MLNWILSKYLKWNGIRYGDKILAKLPREMKERFEREADIINSMSFYRWMIEDMELMTERFMFKGSRDAQLVGKGMLLALNVLTKNVKMAASGKKMMDNPEKTKMTRYQV